MAKTKKYSIITSSILLVLIVVSIIVASLAWFNSNIIDDLTVQTSNYIVLYFESELTADGNKLKPAIAENNAIRDGKNPRTVLTSGSDSGVETIAQAVGLSGSVKFIDFSSGGVNKTLRASIEAYAIDKNNEKTYLSIFRDITVEPTFSMKYDDEENAIVYTDSQYKSFVKSKDSPAPIIDLPITAKNGTLSIALNCYIAEIDELAIPAVMNAEKIGFSLTIQVVEDTRTIYFYNSNAWADVYAYATSQDLQPIGMTGSYYITSNRLVIGSTQYGLTMKKNPDPSATNTAFEYRYLGYKYYDEAQDYMTINFNGTALDLASYTITGGEKEGNAIRISAGAGVYDITINTSTKKISITKNNGNSTFDKEPLGQFPGQKAQPILGQVGWYYINVTKDTELICFNDGKTKTEMISIDSDKNYYFDGNWVATIQDTGKRIFFRHNTGGLSISAICTSATGKETTYKMKYLGNLWYSADIGEDTVQVNFYSPGNVGITTKIQLEDGKPYFYENSWHGFAK